MAFSSRYWALWLALLFTGVAGRLGQRKNINNTHYDFVVLGGGTAGLVIASRLSEDPRLSVAVVEAGDIEKNNPIVTSTVALGAGKNTRLDWQYETTPQTFADNQTLIWSSGKGMGGSSLINGMTYMRPASSQIDLWPTLGLELDWKKLFEFSKKGEEFQPPGPEIVALGASYEASAHGFRGPLATCTHPNMTRGDIHDVFNTTFKSLNIPPRPEFNGGELLGFGVQQMTQDCTVGIREDAARAYYYPVTNRRNLVVIANTTATRIIWSREGRGGRAVASAAEIVGLNGEVSTIRADREIILAAGALRSPALLEFSGVGNPKILSQHSIPLKVKLPSVGENLQDQTTIAITANSLQNFTGFPAFVAHASLNDLFGSNTSSIYESTLAKIPQYAATIAAQNGGASSARVQERLLKTQLEILLQNTPVSEIVPLALENFIGGIFWPLQPLSRGSVHISSANRTAYPIIDPKFFQFDFDGQVSVATARFVRKFLTTAPVADYVNATTINPSFDLIPEDASDAVWLDWIKTKSSFQPNYHHLGTCAMLPKDLGGVVDNDFKVYGTKNVRVVDLGVVPFQVAGHSTALLYGIAEWAAYKIKNHS